MKEKLRDYRDYINDGTIRVFDGRAPRRIAWGIIVGAVAYFAIMFVIAALH